MDQKWFVFNFFCALLFFDAFTTFFVDSYALSGSLNNEIDSNLWKSGDEEKNKLDFSTETLKTDWGSHDKPNETLQQPLEEEDPDGYRKWMNVITFDKLYNLTKTDEKPENETEVVVINEEDHLKILKAEDEEEEDRTQIQQGKGKNIFHLLSPEGFLSQILLEKEFKGLERTKREVEELEKKRCKCRRNGGRTVVRRRRRRRRRRGRRRRNGQQRQQRGRRRRRRGRRRGVGRRRGRKRCVCREKGEGEDDEKTDEEPGKNGEEDGATEEWDESSTEEAGGEEGGEESGGGEDDGGGEDGDGEGEGEGEGEEGDKGSEEKGSDEESDEASDEESDENDLKEGKSGENLAPPAKSGLVPSGGMMTIPGYMVPYSNVPAGSVPQGNIPSYQVPYYPIAAALIQENPISKAKD